MFVGREKELKLLNQSYRLKEDTMVILYGRDGIGKTTLVKHFLQDKSYVYYQARELSQAEQTKYFDEKRKEVLAKTKRERIVFVIDEFDLMQKGYKTFFADLAAYVSEIPKGNIMLLFVSSAVQWVENTMVQDMGELADHITSFIKLKEFTFVEMVDRFPNSTTEECILIYGILGGIPAYLNYWEPRHTVRENIIRIVLDDRGPMHREAQRFLKTSLRELPFYSTILSVLAEDEPKLNYLYARTGFSRAKISVYIKNLMQLDVATKIFSYEPEKKAAIQKGLYGIADSFLHFWYKLVYPKLSELSIMEPEEFYDQYIMKQLNELAEKTYIKVCQEFLELMNLFNHLPARFGKFGSLYGKMGFIPLISNTAEGELLVGSCKWALEPMDTKEFAELLTNLEQIGKEADYYYLFSKQGFTTELAAMTKNMENIQCIDLESM